MLFMVELSHAQSDEVFCELSLEEFHLAQQYSYMFLFTCISYRCTNILGEKRKNTITS